MIDLRRFRLALIAGLAPLLLLGAVSATKPSVALALIGGHPNSPGFRLSASHLVLDGMGLYSRSARGYHVAHFDIGRMTRGSDMVIERDFNPGSVIPVGGVYTIHVGVPSAMANSLDIFTARACVRGVGIAGFGLFDGLLDGWLNASLRSGLRPSLLTFLLNLIGPSGIIDFKVDRMWGETVLLKADRFDSPQGLAIKVGGHMRSSNFSGSCL